MAKKKGTYDLVYKNKIRRKKKKNSLEVVAKKMNPFIALSNRLS